MIPKWQSLPEGPMRNCELVDYVQETLSALFEEENFLSTTRIQNYVKWGVMRPPIGRRYERIHVAEALVLTLLKTVLTTEEIARGIRLQQFRIGTEEAYNTFCDALENALEEVASFDRGESPKLSPSPYLALYAACRAFAYRRYARKKMNSLQRLDEVKNGKNSPSA